MTSIIGHRGASGIEMENTLAAFELAIEVGVDAIELDVRLTSDGQFVVCHDPILTRISDSNAWINQTSYDELRQIPLRNGGHLSLLRDVLELVRKSKVRAIVELKVDDDIEGFCKVLDDYSDCKLTAASFNHTAMETVRQLRPKLPVYLIENQHPVEVVTKARRMGAKGIDLSYYLINPYTYWLARRYRIDIMLYSVDKPWMAKLLVGLYPRIQICTNHPERYRRRRRLPRPHLARKR